MGALFSVLYRVVFSLFSSNNDQIKSQIKVHPLTNYPAMAWEEMMNHRDYYKVNLKVPSRPVRRDKIRFVCMSDTHSMMHKMNFDIPYGDVLIHAGDFTKFGFIGEVVAFNNWIGTLPHPYKVVIAGNHEISFDKNFESIYERKVPYIYCRKTLKHCPDIQDYLTDCLYLEDIQINICGIKIYGTPWQPAFGNWAFNLPRGQECLNKWNKIPSDTDVLITHCPPLGQGDLAQFVANVGCVELLNTVQNRVQPRYHVFGHVHEGYGATFDGITTFINASTCNRKYQPIHPPIVFDMPIPLGFCKDI